MDLLEALGLYLPQIRNFTTFNNDDIRHCILKVGGELKKTVTFLQDSTKEDKFNSKHGRKKSAVVIPRKAVKTEILKKLDECKY